jgi:hypothetical protein
MTMFGRGLSYMHAWDGKLPFPFTKEWVSKTILPGYV